MQVDTYMKAMPLGDIRPNRFRDIENYRLDEAKVEALMASMQSTGLWPTILVRITDEGPELLFGHHRLEAGKRLFGDGYRHNFIVRNNASDHVAIQMMADENADSWGMTVQHGKLCVLQAKKYLDGLLAKYPTWEAATKGAEFGTLAIDLFENEKGYVQCLQEGVGRKVIRKFLGGAFARGKVVEESLALLNDPDLDEAAVDGFANFAQAKAFQKAITGPGAKDVIAKDDQRAVADEILDSYQLSGNGVDPRRSDNRTRLPADRLTAKAVKTHINETIRQRHGGDMFKREVSESAKFILTVEEAERAAKKYISAMHELIIRLEDLPDGAKPNGLPQMTGLLMEMKGIRLHEKKFTNAMGRFVQSKNGG